MVMTVTPLTGAIGAKVEGTRLDANLTDEDFSKIQEAFLKYCVLTFPGQFLTPDEQAAFARRFGEPIVTAMLKGLDGNPEIVQIADVKKETTATEAWHFDAPWEVQPPKISILSAVTVPQGGDTMWSNQYRAYERLEPGLRKTLDGLTGHYKGNRLARMMNVAPEDIPETTHPLVRTHPETGRKALYIGHTDNVSIHGWNRDLSDTVINYLYAHSTSPDNLYRHRWTEGDVVMWDNRCTMHYAVHDYEDQKRVLNRVTLKGEVPA